MYRSNQGEFYYAPIFLQSTIGERIAAAYQPLSVIYLPPATLS
jgi:hypothetical protein